MVTNGTVQSKQTRRRHIFEFVAVHAKPGNAGGSAAYCLLHNRGVLQGPVDLRPVQLSNSIYLVIDGKVKSAARLTMRQVVVDIYQPDEFFGECGFLGEKQRVEEAVALDATSYDVSTAEIEDLVVRRPRLGIALVQLLVRRSWILVPALKAFRSTTSVDAWYVRLCGFPSGWRMPEMER